MPPLTENVTTVPTIGSPFASLTSAVTAPGADELITLALMFITTVPVELETTPEVPVELVDVLDPPAVPEPGPNGDVPALPPPPPQAAKQEISNSDASRFSMVISKIEGVLSHPQAHQRAAERSVTTLGVRKMSNSVLLMVRDRVLNRLPR